MQEVLGLVPTTMEKKKKRRKFEHGGHIAKNPNSREREAGGSKFKASLGYISRPCLKEKKKNIYTVSSVIKKE
jgi:hypothetical protein